MSSTDRTRLPFLDGLRGLAALYVLLHHAMLFVRRETLARPLQLATRWLDHGHAAVCLFIVLSGFLLMRQVLHRGRVSPTYYRDRAKRILPPYYIALAFSAVLIATCPELRRADDPRWEFALPAFSPAAIGSHLLLLHNLRPHWSMLIDPPMWSVATEWQIYFAFPVLVWAWKRLGMPMVVALAFLIGLLPSAIWPGLAGSAVACFWFLGLFALGMLGANLVFGRPEDDARTPAIFVLALACACLLLAAGVSLADAFVGAAATGCLVYLARKSTREPTPVAAATLRAIESRPCRALGDCSYSLYLFHYPLLALASAKLVSYGLTPQARLLMLVLAVAPLCVLFAWLAHWVVEKPFMRRPRSPIAREAEMAAVP